MNNNHNFSDGSALHSTASAPVSVSVAVLLGLLVLGCLGEAAAAPKVSMMPSHTQSQVYANTALNAAITVWGRTWNGTAPYTYTLDYGDGTAAASGTASDPNFIGFSHTYTSAGLKTVTLTVTDSTGASTSKTALIRVLVSPTHQERVQMAIEKGKLNLYQNRTVIDADRVYWINPMGSGHTTTYGIGSTSAAILAFEENDHLPDEDDEEDVYAETVRRGLNTLFGQATSYNIGAAQHTDGIAVRDTDSNDNNRGIYFTGSGGHLTYSTPFAAMAIILAKKNGAAAQAATVPYGTFSGTNYLEFVKDIADQMLWCQGDGSVRGAWEYSVTTASQSRYDGSAQQWPTLMMLAAKDRLGIETPQWALDNIVYGFKVLQSADANNGSIGYSSSSQWRNLAKTGGGLSAFAFAGKMAGTDANATAALNFIQNYWLANPSWGGDLAGWAGHWYAMWGLKKGLQFQGITTLTTSTGDRDWKQDMQAWLLGNATLLDSQGGSIASGYRNTNYMFGQNADGSWKSTEYPGSGYYTSSASQLGMDTAHGVLILSDAVTTPVPVAVIAAVGSQSNKAGFRSFDLDGSGSYHLDANSTIIEYLWDWDASNGIDWNSPDATGPRPTNPGYAAVGTYTVSLRVRDGADPAQTDVTSVQVAVVDTDIIPVAVAKPPGGYPGYSGRVGEAVVLDGTGSYDPDGDVITGYAWDTDGDGQYDDATGATPSVTFNAPYTGTVGLQVTANGKTSTNSAYVEMNASGEDLRLGTIVASNIVFGTSADISIPIFNDSGGSFFSSVQVKLYNGNPFTGGVQLGTTYTVSVPSGGGTTLDVTGLVLNGAEFVWVFLDANRVISEYDETNSLGFVNVGMRAEIGVAGNSTDITDGDSSPSSTDHTNFGSALVAGGSVVRTFTITNSGTSDMTLTSTAPDYVTLSGPGAAAFSVTLQPTSGTIALEGGTQTFLITYDPSAVGTHTATVSIASDDADENPFDFSIQGTGIAPEIAVSGNSVGIADGDATPSAADHTDFGSTTVAGGTVLRSFTITNSGDATLNLTGTPVVSLSGSGASAFSVTTQPASAAVAALGGTQTFQITFDPSVAGIHNATLSIANDDADENSFDIALTGVGDAIPGVALVGTSPFSVDLAASYSDPGATATDTEDGALTPIMTGNTVVPNVPGIYTVTWSATDNAGVTTSATRTVIVRPGAKDKTAPTLAISTPAGSTVAATFNIAGIVRDNFGIQSLIVKLNGATQTLDAPLAFVANTNVPWSVTGVAAENGPNLIEVTATDLNGRSTTVKKTVTFINRRTGLSGTFLALIEPAGAPSNDTFGLLCVTITDSGAFSGSVKLGGASLPFTGVIQNDGQARFLPAQATTFPLMSVTYEYERRKKNQVITRTLTRELGLLAFTVDVEDGLEGAVSQRGDGTVLATCSGANAPFKRTNLVPAARLNLPVTGTQTKGVYNIAFPSKAQTPALAANLYPQGDGFAVLTLTNMGAVSVAGCLADGTSLAASGMLRSDSTVVLYTPLYSNLGAMGGELAFADAADSDVTGPDFLWLRPAQSGAAQYAAGWPEGLRKDAVGTKYAAPASLNFGQGAPDLVNGNASLDLTDGLLSALLRFPVSVNPTTGAFIKIPANSPNFTGTITTASGLLNGTFRHSNGKSVAYKALLLNKGANQGAYGWFLTNGPNGEGGGVTLDPAGP